MSENAKAVLAGIGLAIIIVGVLWIVYGLVTAFLFCAVYFAGWLFSPPRFWKFLGWAGLKILQLFGYAKQ